MIIQTIWKEKNELPEPKKNHQVWLIKVGYIILWLCIMVHIAYADWNLPGRSAGKSWCFHPRITQIPPAGSVLAPPAWPVTSREMRVSKPWGYPKMIGLFHGTSQLEMDDLD